MKKKVINKPVMLNGFMAVSQENNLHILDFVCCEDVQMQAFTGKCKVELMRDGNVYMSELPKRAKNKPLFREDNCSLSHARNGRYYFVFSLGEDEVQLLPQKLMDQASAIARKVIRELMKGGVHNL
jgi:hypothetical protein